MCVRRGRGVPICTFQNNVITVILTTVVLLIIVVAGERFKREEFFRKGESPSWMGEGEWRGRRSVLAGSGDVAGGVHGMDGGLSSSLMPLLSPPNSCVYVCVCVWRVRVSVCLASSLRPIRRLLSDGC